MVEQITLIQLLRVGPKPAKALYEGLGVSQPTLSRLLFQHGESILRFGKARQSQYALRRAIGPHANFPLYRVTATGELLQWGVLHPIMPSAYLVETFATPFFEARTDVHQGLPWYLQDLRPQGFLGRSLARFYGPQLGLPIDPTRWNDDQTLLALANIGHDAPSNLLLGEESASHFQTNSFFLNSGNVIQTSPDDQRQQRYPLLANLALSGEVVGSSAGGEQPKFNTTIQRAGQLVQVLVKFSAPQANAITERWRSLLVCEHLAFQVLRNFFPCSVSELLLVENNGAPQIFLEVPRFDRQSERGRLGVVSLKSLDDEFVGLASDWPKVTAALVRAGKLSEQVAQQVQSIYAFGVLIGNADMHTGNLSFMVDDVTSPKPKFQLAPIYDMLPMALAPRASGQIPDALPPPKISVNPPLAVWQAMLPLAIQYWRSVAEHEKVADDVRQIARAQAEIIDSTSHFVSNSRTSVIPAQAGIQL